jgi:hypothetical protein
MQHVVVEDWIDDPDDDSSWPAELLRSMPSLQHFTSANLPSEVLPGLLADAAGCKKLAHLQLEAATCPNELRPALALLASAQCSASLRALLLHCLTDEHVQCGMEACEDDLERASFAESLTQDLCRLEEVALLLRELQGLQQLSMDVVLGPGWAHGLAKKLLRQARRMWLHKVKAEAAVEVAGAGQGSGHDSGASGSRAGSEVEGAAKGRGWKEVAAAQRLVAEQVEGRLRELGVRGLQGLQVVVDGKQQAVEPHLPAVVQLQGKAGQCQLKLKVWALPRGLVR